MVVAAAVAIAATVFVLRARDEASAERAAQMAADRARAALLSEDERQFQETLRRARRALVSPSSVTIYRVSNQFDEDYDRYQSNAKVAGYPVRAKASLTKADVEAVTTLLTKRETYFPAGESWT